MAFTGIGSRGDVDIQRDVFHPVKTTWQQTTRYALGWCIGYLCLLIVVYLVIWFGWGWDWAWWILRRFWLLLLVPFAVIFGISFPRMSRLYYAVVVKNPRWPGPLAQVDPLAVGYTSAYDYPTYEPEQPETVVHQFEGSITNGGGTSKHWRLRTEKPKAWQRFAQQLTLNTKILRCKFSVRAARRFGVPEDEFDNLQKGWARIGYAETTSRAPNAHYKLTEYGFEYMRNLATTPLPDRGVEA